MSYKPVILSSPEVIMMDNRTTEPTMPAVPGGLIALGSAMIITGVVLALFIAQEVLSAYKTMGEHSFIEGITDRFKDTSLFVFQGEPLLATEHGAAIIAFAIFIMIALLGTHIAIAFIRAGAHIVSPVFPYQIAQFKLQLNRLRAKLDKD